MSTIVLGSDGEPGKKTAFALTPPLYVNDPKYKKYTQQVEKCLASFDNVHEWADFISFLKQLLKTFQAYMQFKEIPRKLIVSKRLSQCLNPALPTGVHQRALDVYAHILAVLGSEGLQKDLALWSSGLFPFFEYAATSVKPTVLNLFDTHYLPLQRGLRPIMKSFILALLPGLEEETGEFFDSALTLLDKLAGTLSQPFFLQNIWLIMLTSPSARGTSLNYLLRRLPRLKPDEDISIFVGRDVGLMIRAISAALEDDDSLVRRSALDILLQALPVDSTAVKNAPEEDRAILMRAATSVVLRRDLALNRRLYSWVLGTDENSQQQMSHLKTHALGLLTSTLKSEMNSPSAEYSASRPFKIFISLLDKWEIGSLLTEALVFDSFKALRNGIEAGADAGNDLSMTASTLYDAVEPHALWKELLQAIVADITSTSDHVENIRMVRYILANFHTHDEEIETVHLPICFSAILEVLTQCIQQDATRIPYRATRETLGLLHDTWNRVRLASFKDRPRVTGEDAETRIQQGSYYFACTFYGIDRKLDVTLRNAVAVPLTAAFEDLTSLGKHIAQSFMSASAEHSLICEAYVQTLMLVTKFSQQMQLTTLSPLVIKWNPDEWLSVILPSVECKAATFSIVDLAVSAVVKLQTVEQLEPRLTINKPHIVSTLTTAVFQYLRPPWASYHMRAVSLLWSLEVTTSRPQIVSIISKSLTSQDINEVRESCEAFGVLWRLTDDAMTPGFRLKVPLMIVLDTLRSDDPNIRRVGETWMRCSLKSYLRLLDPFFYDLCDPAVQRTQGVTEFNGRQIQSFVYERPMDQHYINHLLMLLLSVIKFGGQTFNKVARSTPIIRGTHAGLLERVKDFGGSYPDMTYLDLMVNVLLRFVQSEPKPETVVTMGPGNVQIQSTAVDILQTLIARGDVDVLSLQTAETIIIGKLYICVHTGRLDLQNKLLHLLHSAISAFRSRADAGPARVRSDSNRGESSNAASYTVSSLLIQTLIDGISADTNRPVLQHWLDFVLMTIPQFHDMLQPAIPPLNTCVCKQLSAALSEVKRTSSKDAALADVTTFTTDADFMMLLNAVERLVLLSFSQVEDAAQVDDDVPYEKPHDGSGILGYMSNVFSADGPSAVTEEQTTSKAPDCRSLHEAIGVLYAIWEQLAAPSGQKWGSQEESLTLIFTRSRTRCRRVLEHLFRVHSLEVMESIIDCWSRGTSRDKSAAFELTDVLTSSAQNVVHMICESISMRLSASPERMRRHSLCPTLSDTVLYEFLEQYLRRLEGPLAVQVWGRFLQLVRDTILSLKEFKSQIFSTLRCFTVLADKISQMPAGEDKRIRKELQETFTKVVELCLLAHKSSDPGSWVRRAYTPNVNGNGRDSPLLRESRLDEKTNASSTSLPDGGKSALAPDIVEQINLYFASDIVPNVRKFLVEPDKILGLCSSITTGAIAPALKARTRPLDVDDTVLSVLKELTRISTAMKAWRGPIVDILNDNRSFNSTPEAGKKWRTVIKMLFENDKTALSELLSKVTSAPSANIFTNREYEMLLRSLNLKRLSYVLLTGEKNQFLTQLPTIQEKLVDSLRNVNAPIVQSEVYLCVRILLCRLSPHNLSSFWPTILSEMYRIFESVLISPPSDGAEELSLILAAAKLLDLLLVIQTEEFQIHQWIFITDTVDAVYHPDSWTPAAMIDRLAEVVGELPREGTSKHEDHDTLTTPMTPFQGLRMVRRPFLRTVHQIDSIRDLGPFFNQASISSYESVYNSGGSVDWEVVEDGLYQDMFDGR